MKVLVTGATGLIGRKLIHALLRKGIDVCALARSPEKLPELPEENIFLWSDEQIPSTEAITGCDVIVHLAGEGIADQRWTKARKKRIWESRIQGTKNLVSAMRLLSVTERPKVLISGSAIGIYAESEQPQDESSPQGNGFLTELTTAWETEAKEAQDLGVRTVLVRTGLVLSNKGGLLSKSGPIVLGSGQQWMSWIHIQDMIRFILFAMDTKDISGAYNLTAPNPVRNKEFTKKLAHQMGIPMTLPAPALALKLALGEMSQAVLANQKILPKRAQAAGFEFTYNTIDDAFKNLVGHVVSADTVFSSKQFVPLERKNVFPFFSKAENLEILTPPWLNFHIQTKSTPEIEKGTLIDYSLKIHGVPVKWRTSIQEWSPDTSFVDFQLKGPYQKWHHVHTFEDVPGGTLISDEVTFKVPGWVFGKLLLPLVKKDVQTIFSYRQKKIKELYRSGNLK